MHIHVLDQYMAHIGRPLIRFDLVESQVIESMTMGFLASFFMVIPVFCRTGPAVG